MALSANQIFLYAAGPHDYANARKIASNYGIPFGNTTGSFAMAYAAIKSGKFLVTAVGGAANDALYYNQCGFSGFPTGSTPFSIQGQNGTAQPPIATLPSVDYYENAAGTTAQYTFQIASNYVAFALGQTLPYPSAPAPQPAYATCTGSNPIYADSSYYTGG